MYPGYPGNYKYHKQWAEEFREINEHNEGAYQEYVYYLERYMAHMNKRHLVYAGISCVCSVLLLILPWHNISNLIYYAVATTGLLISCTLCDFTLEKLSSSDAWAKPDKLALILAFTYTAQDLYAKLYLELSAVLQFDLVGRALALISCIYSIRLIRYFNANKTTITTLPENTNLDLNIDAHNNK